MQLLTRIYFTDCKHNSVGIWAAVHCWQVQQRCHGTRLNHSCWRCPVKGVCSAGYVYLVFESDKSVRALLHACSQDPFHPEDNREYYFKMSSRRMRCKDVSGNEPCKIHLTWDPCIMWPWSCGTLGRARCAFLLQVQVIPWVISDSNYVRCPAQRLDPSKTVFVGALHGMLNAEALASIMNDLFGGVMYAGIDTDKHKYPIGELGWSAFVQTGAGFVRKCRNEVPPFQVLDVSLLTISAVTWRLCVQRL